MKTVLLALLPAVFAVSVLAQTFGEITGRVQDPSGAAVPATSVTATNVATNAVRQAVTTESGDYTFPSVPPGAYRLKMEHAGFKTTSTESIEVRVQQTVRM